MNRRLHALCAFGASVSTIEVVAPRSGRRTLADYFAQKGGTTIEAMLDRAPLEPAAGGE